MGIPGRGLPGAPSQGPQWAGDSFQPLSPLAPEGRRSVRVWGQFGERRPLSPGLSL